MGVGVWVQEERHTLTDIRAVWPAGTPGGQGNAPPRDHCELSPLPEKNHSKRCIFAQLELTKSSAQGNCSAKSLAPVVSLILPCPPCILRGGWGVHQGGGGSSRGRGSSRGEGEGEGVGGG